MPRPVVQHGDVRRRWAEARVRDLVVENGSSELAADVARRARLLTPWTGFFVVSTGATVGPATPLRRRVRDPSAVALLGRDFATRSGWNESAGAILEPPPEKTDGDADFRALIAAAARRTLDLARPGMRRCRAARAAARPELSGSLEIRVELTGAGRVSDVAVRASRAADDDPALNRCVAALISSLRFFDSGTETRVTVEYEFELPPPPDLRARKCSQTSKMPLALRLAVWRARLTKDGLEVYDEALRSCEIPRWDEQRALLDLLFDQESSTTGRLALMHQLEGKGYADASAYVRRMVIRGARTPEQLAEVRAALFQNEPEPGKAFAKQYDAAKNDQERLAVVRRFLLVSPHSPVLRRALFGLLDATGSKDSLEQAIYDVRQDPFSDATLIADGGSWLRHLGRNTEGLRAFGELVERAPHDPYARATAGDRLRDERLFDEATVAYDALIEMLPDDPAAVMRLALAHAGAGRLDLATRTLTRVAQTGGRTGNQDLGELASITSAVLLAQAKARAKGEEAKRLARRLAETPMPDVAGVVLTRTPSLRNPVQVRVSRAREGADSFETMPDLSAPTMGLFAQRVERGDQELRVRLWRDREIGPTLPVEVSIDLLELDDQRNFAKHSQKKVTLPADGEDVEVRFDQEASR